MLSRLEEAKINGLTLTKKLKLYDGEDVEGFRQKRTSSSSASSPNARAWTAFRRALVGPPLGSATPFDCTQAALSSTGANSSVDTAGACGLFRGTHWSVLRLQASIVPLPYTVVSASTDSSGEARAGKIAAVSSMPRPVSIITRFMGVSSRER